MKNIRIILLPVFLLVCSAVSAQIKLPALFSDNMVLQQKTTISLWGWADTGKVIHISPSWNNKTFTTHTDASGKWLVQLQTPEAGGPYEISLSDGKEIKIKNILIGEVWLCAGQSNMEMPMKGFLGQPVYGSNDAILRSENPNIRFISVPRSAKTTPQYDFDAHWSEAAPKSVAQFSATAYFFGRLLNEILDVPIGLIEVSYGGSCIEAWMSPEISGPFEGVDIPEPDNSPDIDNRTPTVLFNGMLYPVIGYGIRGAIWYQGETNYINAAEYLERFPAMVKDWRVRWGQGDFPFYYVQIAPFDYSVFHIAEDWKENYNSAYLREAQLKALDRIPNSGMAVLLDAGEEKNIHPPDKELAGKRLAFWALAKTYGIEGIGYASPSPRGLEIKDGRAIISFHNVPNGITCFNKEITLFEIAGKDKKFYPAKAIVRRKSVVLSAPEVPDPVAIRYAFKNFVRGELFSTEGLPVSSFRTDEW